MHKIPKSLYPLKFLSSFLGKKCNWIFCFWKLGLFFAHWYYFKKSSSNAQMLKYQSAFYLSICHSFLKSNSATKKVTQKGATLCLG